MDRKLINDPGFEHPSVHVPANSIPQYIPCAVDESADCCPECGGYVFNPETTPPNRFDPYEALDEILVVLAENRDLLSQFNADRIRSHVRALRAYITGMEK